MVTTENTISFTTEERIEVIERDKLEDFKILINENPGILSIYNTNVFPMAVANNSTKILEYLGKNHKLIIGQNEKGDNALHHAVSLGHFNVVKWLCEKQLLSPNIQNNEGKTVLHLLASFEGCPQNPSEMLPFLLGIPDIDPNILDNDRYTALYYAAMNGWYRAVKLLANSIEENGLGEALEIASFNYDFTKHNSNSDRYKVYDHLYNKRYPSKKKKTYKPDIRQWEENINTLMRLVPHFFSRDLSLVELENRIDILNQDDLCIFRAKYQNLFLDSECKIEKTLRKQNKEASDYVKKYDEEIIPVFHILKHLKNLGEIINKVRFSDINENTKECAQKYGDALLTLLRGDTKKLQVTTALDNKGEIKSRELRQLREEGGGHLDQELKYYELCKKFPEYPPLPKGIILTKELFSNRLLKAMERKIERYDQSDWLIITIDMGCWSDEPRQNGEPMFYAVCKDFGNRLKALQKIKFKRVFVFLENEHTNLNKIWDSGAF